MERNEVKEDKLDESMRRETDSNEEPNKLKEDNVEKNNEELKGNEQNEKMESSVEEKVALTKLLSSPKKQEKPSKLVVVFLKKQVFITFTFSTKSKIKSEFWKERRHCCRTKIFSIEKSNSNKSFLGGIQAECCENFSLSKTTCPNVRLGISLFCFHLINYRRVWRYTLQYVKSDKFVFLFHTPGRSLWVLFLRVFSPRVF